MVTRGSRPGTPFAFSVEVLLSCPRSRRHHLLVAAVAATLGCGGRSPLLDGDGLSSGSSSGAGGAAPEGSTGGATSASGSTTSGEGGSVSTGSTSIGAGTSSSGATGTGSGGGPACSPVQGVVNLLQGSLPTDDGYENVASDGQFVYFRSNAALYRVPVSGGPAETLYAGPFGGFFAANGGTVAWEPLMSSGFNPAGLTVKNGAGVQSVPLAGGALPAAAAWMLADTSGNVFFEVNVPGVARSQTWRWSATTGPAGEMPGVGMPDAGAGTNLYWADRGEVIWANNLAGPAGGIYATEIATGIAHLIVGNGTDDFGGLVGVDAENLYGEGSICPMGACPFTIYGVSRAGGAAPFVAYQTQDAYWTVSLHADDSGLYWMNWKTLGIYHAALSTPGAPAELVVHPASGIAQFALDACNVYWLDVDATGTMSVMATAK